VFTAPGGSESRWSEPREDDGSNEEVFDATSEDADDVVWLFSQLKKAPDEKGLDELSSMLSSLERQASSIAARHVAFGRMTTRFMQAEGLEASVVHSGSLVIAPRFQLPSTDVIDVVLDKLPMPSENTPWEQILDFKADTEAQGYLQGLKVWMGDVARQKLRANEAREKLEWLLFQHKKHLKAHKLSYRWGTLGGTFVATAEILEDLAKIKWGKAAGAVVSIFDRRLELMKAELANPAKEISYIVKAQEQFGE
jgi:hypothetical protein